MISDLIRCALCGNVFDAASAGCSPACPLAKGCSALCCPRCHYTFPRETGLAAVLRRVLVRLETRRAP